MSDPLGAFSRKLDTNWRVALPDPLLDVYPRKLILCPGLDRSIRIYRSDKWDEFERDLKKLNRNNPRHAEYIRFFRSMAQTITLDTNNRFRFSDPLMKWAGLGEDNRNVVIFDSVDYLEAWEEERWDKYMEAQSEQIKELALSIYGDLTGSGDEHAAGEAPAGTG